MLEPYSPDILWLVIVGFIVAFILAFGIGANDVANSFGTSVGSKVLTVRQACYLATVFEIAGAVLIGYKVSDTMRKDLLDITLYDSHEKELMLGCLASLASSAVWLIVATFLKLPISGTHSIVGATVGFSLVCRGTQGINWRTLGMIVASWFVSPVLSGIMSCLLFKGIYRWILQSPHPIVPGLRAMPVFYGLTILVNVFSIVHNGPKLLYFDRIPIWGVYIISISVGVLVALFVQFFIVPSQRRKILEQTAKEKSRGVSFTFGGSTDSSREPSPRPSRNISADDIARENALPMINEDAECQEKPSPLEMLGPNDELAHLSAAKTSNQQTYRFNMPKEGTDSRAGNGYILAETALNNVISDPHVAALSTKNGVSTDPKHLNLPGSGQVTPAFGLSPNSSAVPLIKEKVPESLGMVESGQAGCGQLHDDEPEEVSRIFSFLQVLTATFGSFAHGGNDVSNAIGPLIAIWLIYHDGSVRQQSETPLSILLFGGVGISVGLWLWGRRVIQTVGEDLTKITASTGFTIEIGAAFTVLLASKIGIPISTTHCKVGSVVFVGFVRSSGSGVDWKLFRNIIYAWVVTVPVAAGLSAGFMAAFRGLLL